MIEVIEWKSTTDKPDEYVPILIYVPSSSPDPTVHEAYYMTINGEGTWNMVHPMYGGFVSEMDIRGWAYMPKGIDRKSN